MPSSRRPCPRIFSALAVVVPCALAAPSAAQRAADGHEALAISRHVRALELVEGELWAYGATYKARFDTAGLMVIPPLGPEAPEDLPLWLALESISVGDVELDTGDPLAPPVRGELAVEYARGPSITERYDVRAEGLEQSFVLRELPAERGEIVVRLRVATELVARADGREGGGLIFADERTAAGERGLHYGALTAIDARGARAAGQVRRVGDRIELAVAADFVASAELPLVLDPVVGDPHDLFTTANDVGDPDVAAGFGTTVDYYFVAFERRWSATDIDVYGQRILFASGLYGPTVILEGTIATVAMNPSVAFGDPVADFPNTFFTVWQQGSSVSGPFDVAGRAVDMSSPGFLSATVVIAGTASSEIDPAVSYLADALYSTSCTHRPRFLVAWARDGIRARSVDIDTCNNSAPLQSAELAISTSPNDSLPALAYMGEVDFMDEVFVVWERFFSVPAPGDRDLQRAVVRNVFPDAYSLAITVADGALVTTVGPDEGKPDVARLLGPQMGVTYERAASSAASDDDVLLTLVPYHMFPLGTLLDPPNSVNVAVGTGDDDAPAIGGAWNQGGTGYEQVWVGWVSHGAFGFSAVSGAGLQTAPGVDPSTALSVCHPDFEVAGGAIGAAFRDVELESGTEQGLAAFESIGFGVYAKFISNLDLGEGPYYPGILGCGGGGVADHVCPCSLGTSFVHAVRDAAPVRPAFLIMSFDAIHQICGACTLVADPYGGFVIPGGFTSATGTAKLPMAIPSLPELEGLTFIDQWAIVEPAAGCTVLDVSLSVPAQFTIHHY